MIAFGNTSNFWAAMINRTCLCGCGLSFKVLPTNTTNYFYSKGHLEFAKSRKDEVGALARKIALSIRGHRPTIAQKKARRRAYRTEYVPSEDLTDADDH